jgi:DNA-directed RNA polymerase specialized sigma24 family protein
MSDVERLLERIDSGDTEGADELLPIVYDQLRRLAHSQLSDEAPGQSLQTADLVHEAYLRLVGADQQWHSRGHFLAAAAEAMRLHRWDPHTGACRQAFAAEDAPSEAPLNTVSLSEACSHSDPRPGSDPDQSSGPAACQITLVRLTPSLL